MLTPNKSNALPHLLVGAVMISFSGVWVKVSHVAPVVSAFYRVFFGGLILLVVVLLKRENSWRDRRFLSRGLLCGLFFALDLAFYHYAVHYVGPGLGTILPNFQVFILAAVGVVFMGERLRLTFLASVPLALLGLFLVVGVGGSPLEADYRKGVLCGLAAAACYAGFLLSIRKLQGEQQGVTFFSVLAMVSLATAAFLALEILRLGASFAIPGGQSLLALVALGFGSQFAGWLLITNALPHIRASLSGLILLLQPALAFVWDVLFFHRPTSLLNWTGVLLALLAIYLGAHRPSAAR
ncbi:MAG: DMT family transporter [Desulfobacterales bacterium]|nr:DMT family transporter [Desulfobacterales bacterium]